MSKRPLTSEEEAAYRALARAAKRLKIAQERAERFSARQKRGEAARR